MQSHLRRHLRFYFALFVGVLAWAIAHRLGFYEPVALAGEAFFLTYLISVLRLITRSAPSDVRQRAASRDEGAVVIILLTLGAATLSLGTIFILLSEAGPPSPGRLFVALLSAPLGWTTLHTVMAFHYAHGYYAPNPTRDGDAGGLQFPGEGEPTYWDFIYFSFVIGMTAQVSDVQVLTTAMRRFTLGHAFVSFFFNTVILALAVNVSAGLSR